MHRQHAHTYSTSDFTVGEASYNNEQSSKECPQVGCTLFRYLRPTRCVIDKLGGAVGTYFGDPLDVFSSDPEECNKVDALCFSGGSLHGLIAVGGVAEAMAKENIDRNIKVKNMYSIPVVRGAITFSGAWGKVPEWKPPDSALGKLALSNAVGRTVRFGQHGAGSNAEVGSIQTGDYGVEGGQGAYCDTNENGIYCAVYCNLNAKGVVLGMDGSLLYGPRLEKEKGRNVGNQFRSTNILVHTNAKCKSIDLMRQLARQVHVSMSRVISPYSAHSDGDVLFLTSSEEKEVEDTVSVGVFFSKCLQKAVYAMVGYYLNGLDGAPIEALKSKNKGLKM